MTENADCGQAIAHSALQHGQQHPFALHTIGGKHPDGTPIALGPWTFETPQVRRVVESYLTGSVLNACAGKTHLSHDDIHRNDLDDCRDADTHFDVCTLDESLPVESFDVVVFDPPFDSDQAAEHYDGNTVGRGPSGGLWAARDALANLTAPGGRVLSVGWNSVGLQHKDDFEREAIHLFQRVQKPDVVLVVDRKTQTRLVTDGGERQGRGTSQSERKRLKFARSPFTTLAIAEECDRLAATIRYDDEKQLAEGDELDVVYAESGEKDGTATVEHTETVPVRRALDVVLDWWAEYSIERPSELVRALNEFYDDPIHADTEVKVIILNPSLDGEWGFSR